MPDAALDAAAEEYAFLDHRDAIEAEIAKTIADWIERAGWMSFPAGSLFDHLWWEVDRLRPIAKKKPSKRKLPAATRRRIMERDAYRCVKCGSWSDLTIDHVIPESRGGSDEDDNLQTMCRPCNLHKGTKV